MENPQGFLARPLTLLPFALTTLLVGPLPEEPGWRGYALDKLQEHWSALRSSLVLAFFWWAWRLPMFFTRGTGIGELWPIGSLPFWVNFTLSLPATTLLMTWAFNNTRSSTLGAILFHFTANFSGEFLDMPNQFHTSALPGASWPRRRSCGCMVPRE
ncbi:MAG TPA: CPBP family intramembrane glutamic endopeptidase [Anaerolineales bacterium]|nr:CPBP family intramembrane glutamic endopeptidase [Anaerolineales bacterium]